MSVICGVLPSVSSPRCLTSRDFISGSTSPTSSPVWAVGRGVLAEVTTRSIPQASTPKRIPFNVIKTYLSPTYLHHPLAISSSLGVALYSKGGRSGIGRCRFPCFGSVGLYPYTTCTRLKDTQRYKKSIKLHHPLLHPLSPSRYHRGSHKCSDLGLASAEKGGYHFSAEGRWVSGKDTTQTRDKRG